MNSDTQFLKRWQTPQEYIEDSPLSESELESGRFLRAVRCRWGGLGEFRESIAWVVLYGRTGAKGAGAPSVEIDRASFAFFPPEEDAQDVSGDAALCESLTASYTGKPLKMAIRGRVWTVFELEVVVPAAVKEFSFSVDGVSKTIEELERWGNLEVFYDETRNAWAPGGGFPEWFAAQKGSYGLEPRSEGPLMSIVIPAWHTPKQYLREAIECIRGQLYSNWELVVVNASPDDEAMLEVFAEYADEPRIQVVERPENDGIVGNTNFGLQFTHGDYVSFMDHDDLVEPEALLLYVQAIDEAAAAGERVAMLYCDEDSIDENLDHLLPFLKPPANLDLLLNNNYAVHWLTVSREVLDATERSDKEVEGAQDYDLSLKAFEYAAEKGARIVHVPHIMYHWRICAGSTNTNPDAKPYAEFAGQKAVEGHFARRSIPCRVLCEPALFTYRALPGEGTGPSLDVFVHGGSPSTALFRAVSEYVRAGGAAQVIPLSKDTPAARNRALARSSADIVAFLPSDVESLEGDGLAAITGQFLRPEVGVVSPRVVRADGTVEYQNIIVTPEGRLTCLERFLPLGDWGYLGRNERPYAATVAYAPAVFLRRETARDAGGFDRAYRSCDYALAQLCLKMADRGAVTSYCPYLVVRRAEFASALGVWAAPDALADRVLFARRNAGVFAGGDPSHNPNFDPRDPYFLLEGRSWYSVPRDGMAGRLPDPVVKAKRALERTVPRPNLARR